jgi:hypothetical protein
VIKTNLQGKDPSLFGRLQGLMVHVTATASTHDGALNTLFCATSPQVVQEGQGRYFVPVGKLQHRVDKWLDDESGNKALWQWSEEVNGRVK